MIRELVAFRMKIRREIGAAPSFRVLKRLVVNADDLGTNARR